MTALDVVSRPIARVTRLPPLAPLAGALVVVSGLIAIASGLPRRMSDAGSTMPQ